MLKDSLLHLPDRSEQAPGSEKKRPALDRTRLPKHIAIIMDGNGRWAKRKGMERNAGYRAGLDALRETVRACCELEIKCLTVYAFSTENWDRPQGEVEFLMHLIEDGLSQELQELHDQGVHIRMLGSRLGLSPSVVRRIDEAEALTAGNDRLHLNVALNYGGRSEIVEAARAVATQVAAGRLTPDQIDEAVLSANLYTAGLPDPDLLIRTGGERRLSNFLLWQVAYAELWVTPVHWPDFGREDLITALIDYQSRERRFGRV